MSVKKYIDELLQGAEVEWKPLGEVALRIFAGGTPKTNVREYWENGKIPWMSSGEVNLGIIHKTEKYITEQGMKNSNAKIVPPNSVVIALAGQGKTRGKVARTRIELTTNQSLAAITFDETKVCSDYIYFFLTSQYDKLRQISSGNGTRGGLNLQMICSFEVPLPPLLVQEEIVRILDKFITLEAELDCRKRQYEYYRNQLLSFDMLNRGGKS